MNTNQNNDISAEQREDKIGSGFKRLVDLDKKRNLSKVSVKEVILNFFRVFEHKISFDEYMDMLSKSIDESVIEEQKREPGKIFMGGHISFSISDDKKFMLFNVENYYKKGEEWFKNKSGGKTPLSKFDNGSAQMINEILKKQENGEVFEYKIDPPSMPDDQ